MFFFLCSPVASKVGFTIRKHGRCTEKMHSGQEACDNHVGPLVVLYLSGALDCGLPWRPMEEGRVLQHLPFMFFHTSISHTKLVSLWHQSFDVRWKTCKISTLAYLFLRNNMRQCHTRTYVLNISVQDHYSNQPSLVSSQKKSNHNLGSQWTSSHFYP